MTHSVLVIDDSPEIHQLLVARLKPEDLKLHHATGAEEGLRMARELHPDLVLLDVDMPERSGFDVCQMLKRDFLTSMIPIIFLTGTGDVATKVRGFDLGAIDYVTKPFEPAELRARVRAALRTKRYHDLLAVRVQVDALTDLWNRSYFDQRLADELRAAQRYGRRLSLIMADVDHFKRINDHHGHPFGDRVLQAVGEVFSKRLRVTDAPCRYGGEEFAILLPETDLKGALIAAHALADRLRELSFQHRGQSVRVTASFGVASVEQCGADFSPPRLLSLADDALYLAKRSGRDRVCQAIPPGQAGPSIGGGDPAPT